MRLAALHHRGPYSDIGPAFQTLGRIAGAAGLFQQPGAMMMGVYQDDPRTTPPADLRSSAAVVIPDTVTVPEGLVELRLEGGRFACLTHVGSYEQLPDAWRRAHEALGSSGHRPRAGASYERYLNDPTRVPEAELQTEICLPIE